MLRLGQVFEAPGFARFNVRSAPQLLHPVCRAQPQSIVCRPDCAGTHADDPLKCELPGNFDSVERRRTSRLHNAGADRRWR
eukprot:scaffold7099_cov131-Isochrysis_galbana.AAC.13